MQLTKPQKQSLVSMLCEHGICVNYELGKYWFLRIDKLQFREGEDQ